PREHRLRKRRRTCHIRTLREVTLSGGTLRSASVDDALARLFRRFFLGFDPPWNMQWWERWRREHDRSWGMRWLPRWLGGRMRRRLARPWRHVRTERGLAL